MAVAGNGNVYAAGGFSGTADFDPGPGVFNLTSNGSNDIFVSGLESNGDFGWAGGIGSWPQSPRAFGLAGDADGNAYVTGNFTETVDFDPSPGVFELSSGIRDSIFVSKLDSNGTFV